VTWLSVLTAVYVINRLDIWISLLRTTSIATKKLHLLAQSVDSIIRKRSNSICHYHCLAGNSTIIFSTIQPFQFAKSLLKLSEVSCSHAGWRRSWIPLLIDLIFESSQSIPAVYQRTFNQLIQILHCLVDGDLFWAFWRKPRDSTANGCNITVY